MAGGSGRDPGGDEMTTINRIPRSVAALLLCVCALPTLTAAQSVPTIEPKLTRLYGSDSLNLWYPASQAALSPDGRWVVFNTVEGADRMNLWIASVADGRATRLTDGLYYNGQPRWFPSGDRIAFRSSRFASPPSVVAHIVSLGIDPETGRPTGPVRQITLEPSWGNGYAVSPDGKWIAYTTDEQRSAPPVARGTHSARSVRACECRRESDRARIRRAVRALLRHSPTHALRVPLRTGSRRATA